LGEREEGKKKGKYLFSENKPDVVSSAIELCVICLWGLEISQELTELQNHTSNNYFPKESRTLKEMQLLLCHVILTYKRTKETKCLLAFCPLLAVVNSC